MHETLANFPTVGLFLTLLSVITRTRKDDRFRCWLASWLSVMAYFAAEDWRPANRAQTALQSSLSEALAVGAIFFALSSMILTERRTASFRVATSLTHSSRSCSDAASTHR